MGVSDLLIHLSADQLEKRGNKVVEGEALNILVGSIPLKAAPSKAAKDGKDGAKRNAVLLNAGAAIYVAGKADSIDSGIKIAKDMIDSGKAKAQLERFIEQSNK